MSIAQSSVRDPNRKVQTIVSRSLAAAALVLMSLSAPLVARAAPTSTPTTSSDSATVASTAPVLVAQASTSSDSATTPAPVLMAQATPAASSSATAQNGAAGADQLSEVVVTAERVAGSEMKTPIAITALTTTQLQETNVNSTTDLRGLVPSLNIIHQGGGGAGSFGNNQVGIYIRGVGTTARFFNNDTGIAVYLDDIYAPDTQNLNLSFYDLQSVQILNGPQGTLFGRNSFGGAMLIQPAPPGQEFGGFGQVTVGSYDRVDTQGALNMPFSDALTSRLSVYTSDVNGYITHLLNDQTNDDIHEKSVRYQLSWHPNADFSADLLAEYGDSHDNGNEEITIGCNPAGHYVKDYATAHPGMAYCTQFAPLGQKYEVYGNSTATFPNPVSAYCVTTACLNAATPAQITATGPAGLGPVNGATAGSVACLPNGIPATAISNNCTGGYTPFDQGEADTYALHLTYQVNDELTLKSITGLRRSDLNSYRDDGTPVGLYTEQDVFWNRSYTEELQALAKLFDGHLNLVGGLFGFHEQAASIQDTGPDYDDPNGYYYGNTVVEESVAAYMQATLTIDKYSLIVGARGTHDLKESASKVWEGCDLTYAQELVTQEGGCWIPGPGPNNVAYASNTWHHFDPRVQFQIQWTPDVMTYVSATSGYLSGGFNAQLPFLPPAGVPPASYYNLPFEQETLWNYEVGLKGEWFNHRLRFQGDAYDMIFNNYQGSVLEYYGQGGISLTCTSGNCIDVSTTTSSADAHERGVEIQIDAIPITDLTLSATYSHLGQGYDAIFPAAFAAGLRKAAALTSAPLQTASLSGSYIIHLGNGATLVPSANWRFEGQQWSGTFSATSYNQYLAPSYALLGANVTYKSMGDKWEIGFWANNLLQKYYYETYTSPKILNTNIGLQQVTPGRPREMGATFHWNF